MAENYKELYHWAKYMLDKYQDEIVPGLREQLAKRVEVVRCKDCIHYYEREPVCLKIYSDGGVSEHAWQERKSDDFCSYGERRANG